MNKYIAILSTWWWHLGTFTQDIHCPFHTLHLRTAVGNTVFPMALPEVQCTGKKERLLNRCAIQPLLHTISILFLSCDLQMIQDNQWYLMKRSVNISLFVMTWKRRATSTADQSKLHEWSVRLQRAGQAEFTLSSKHRLFTGLPQEQKFTGTSVFKAHMMVIDIKMLPSERTAYCMWSWSYPQPKSFAENTVNTPYTVCAWNSKCTIIWFIK